MRLYAVYALPLKGKSQKKDELRKRLHTLHTTMRKVYSALLLPMFPTSGPNCIQTAYTVHTNCIQTTVCEGTVNTSMATTDATPQRGTIACRIGSSYPTGITSATPHGKPSPAHTPTKGCDDDIGDTQDPFPPSRHVCSRRARSAKRRKTQSAVRLKPVFDRFRMRLYAVYALPLKGKSQKKDELRKQLHTLHTSM